MFLYDDLGNPLGQDENVANLLPGHSFGGIRISSFSVNGISHLTLIFNITSKFDQMKMIEFQLKKKLSHDFAKYLKDPDSSDVILYVDNVVYPAHKFVLLDRSPVFAAMFQHDMAESRMNAVDIPHIKINVFELALKFIYTGDVNGVELFASELLAFADQYQLEQLKDRCEDVMIDKLSHLNALNYLVLADLHYASKLKETAVEYINENKKMLTATPEMKDFAKSHSLLLLELYANISCLCILSKFNILKLSCFE